MDPEFYRQMNTFSVKLPPTSQRPPKEPVGEKAGQSSAQETVQPNNNWTVYNPSIMRGNFEGAKNAPPQDPRQNVGWTSEAGMAREESDMPWMSTTNQQPLLWSMDDTKDDEATPRASDHAENYPHPSLSLPHPSLNLDFRMSVTLNPRISVGQTPLGHRNWISFTGGTWSGSWGAGIVLPGGQDSQLIIPDGSARLETNYILETYDQSPAHIVVKTHGWRTGPPEILAQLADPELADKVDPSSYKFRIFIEMETGDERYRDKVNCGMWIGSGMRKGAEVVYDAYRVS